MSIPNQYKLKNLLQHWPNGTVSTASYIESLGISKQLRHRYRKSQWIDQLSKGVFKKFDDKISWQGGIYAIQAQARLNIYVGALTAIELQGRAHYIRMGMDKLYLFAANNTTLPHWFKIYDWEADIKFHSSNFLPNELGLSDYEVKDFKIKISSLERAILECLYLAPNKINLVETYQIMEGLTTLRPDLLQELLEGCTSVKVIRLFLYMAEKANHSWFKYLNKEKFDVGKGDRCIIKHGVYVAKYKITVPKELLEL
jgi:hypothetical protein